VDIESLATSTSPGAGTGAPAKSLVSFWDEARLRVAHAKSSSVKVAPGCVPWRAALEDVLHVGYGAQTHSHFVAGAWEQVRWRTTPSAGALYPFEVIAIVAGEGSYLWDVEKGRLVSCGLPALSGDELAAAGLVTAPGRRLDALLVLVARPWLSMRKYRQRGYPYCHLDVGHVAANLAIYTAALGLTPALHLRFSRSRMAAALKLDGLCREPLAVLSFASAELAAELPAIAWLEPPPPGPPPGSFELPAPEEVRNWQSLQGILSLDSPIEAPGVPARAPLVLEPAATVEDSIVPLPDGRLALSAVADWRSAIIGRRSAKGFRHEPLSVAQLGALLGALRGEGAPADCAAEMSSRLGVRLVASHVDGLQGVFAYAPRSHALHRLDSQADDPRPACMHQQVAANVAALVIFHAPLCRLMAQRGYSAFAELHCHAAQLGQRLHLAAARLGAVGLTCIGGFDGDECATLGRFDAGDEAVYVVLLGIPDDAAFKHDRLNVAYSHGYTTLEG
jgi:SagB-type dehydrogenase family enzyme